LRERGAGITRPPFRVCQLPRIPVLRTWVNKLSRKFLENYVGVIRDIVIQATMLGDHKASRSERRVNDEKRIPSSKEQAKAKRRKILEHLNTMDAGVSRYDMEQEALRARGIDIARERERRPVIGT